ncbi:TIGR03915 family putative DNA repair protein [Geomobilimonas luticola]|uniref:TIGR03915 family putative DNA repair protein n=1 Tax=Geomobilimonas luticola TaxID=1114878 RepID=A0ABS5SEB0_9BACT|nr:TIGR03915 family putative DNA repair protein [Geomobilimonas luticola]MBT0653706.1 TIGR03915 family putative DNA repair protein [Geomobilimonas luticola]
MTSYLYDGTFAGLLTVLALVREGGEETTSIGTAPPAQAGLFAATVRVEADAEDAERLLDEIGRRMSPATAAHLYHAFLSETEGAEMLLHHYLRLGWQEGRCLDSLLSHPSVLPVHRLAHRVRFEAHRLKGFVRFREVREGFYYAPLEPDYRVLTLMAPHFADRFHDQDWVIHDVRRNRAIVHGARRKGWEEVALELTGSPVTGGREEWFQSLWRRYFDRLAIAERHNPRLQQGKVPLKYRRYLVEF